MSLNDFLPYRLAIVAEAVSREVSQVYREKFDLTRDEWRILALLGETGSIKTREARQYTTLDKVQVSRAVNSMLSRKLLTRTELAEDRRNHVIALTSQGVTLYQQVIPEVLRVEAAILRKLTKTQINSLTKTLDQLLSHVSAAHN
ncbi:MAG: MarR family winged helix-turn-helix transcriptional regulator [Burkholderiaceae bacterium]